jgi:preprotein translocase subunit YajC
MPSADGGTMGMVMQLAPFILIFVLFYFLMIRPQQRRMQEHQKMIAAVKRGDSVVLSNGMIGKVTRVEEAEAMVEISQGVNVAVVKSMISEVRAKGEPAKVADKSKKS